MMTNTFGKHMMTNTHTPLSSTYFSDAWCSKTDTKRYAEDQHYVSTSNTPNILFVSASLPPREVRGSATTVGGWREVASASLWAARWRDRHEHALLLLLLLLLQRRWHLLLHTLRKLRLLRLALLLLLHGLLHTSNEHTLLLVWLAGLLRDVDVGGCRVGLEDEAGCGVWGRTRSPRPARRCGTFLRLHARTIPERPAVHDG